MWIMFSYSGWNASTYLGRDKEPRKNLPALIYGTFIVMALYIGINILYVYGIEPKSMEG